MSIYRSVALSKCNEIHKLLPAGDSAAALPQVLGTASLREKDGDGDGAVAGARPGSVTGCVVWATLFARQVESRVSNRLGLDRVEKNLPPSARKDVFGLKSKWDESVTTPSS